MNKQFRLLATVKAVELDDAPNGAFEAVISAPTLDRDGEVIDSGAFDPLPKSIPILADHEGMVRSLVARAEPFYDGDVLKARGRYASHPFAQHVRSLVNEEILDTMSVGYMPPERKMVGGVPHVVKTELLEASFVVIPSNRDALVTTAKSMQANTDDGKQYVDVEPVEGSFEDVQEALRESMRSLYSSDSYLSILATFDNRCIFQVESWPARDTDGTYEVAYSRDELGEVTIETPVAVEVTQVVSPKTLHRLITSKAGRRNASKDQTNLDAAHDSIVAAGATCPSADDGGDSSKGLDALVESTELDLDLIDLGS